MNSANIGYTTNESQFEPSTPNTANVKTKKEKAKPKAEPIKLKIKTNARLRNNQTDLPESSEEPEVYRGRSTRRQTPQHTTIASSVEDNAPVPGTANYELYRTLTESPKQFENQQSHFDHTTSDLNHHQQSIPIEYQQFHSAQLNQANIPAHLSPDIDAQNTNSDTERGILPKKRRGRNKAKFEANTETIVDEPVQKRQRGRRKHDEHPPELIEPMPTNELVSPQSESPIVEEIPANFPKKRITAAAKKQYRDESSTILSEPAIPSPAPIEPLHPSEEVPIEPVTNRRGRKAKAKANQNITNTEQMSQPEVSQRPTRTTRHTANGNMTRVS